MTEDDDNTTDNDTILTKAILNPDGSCPKHPDVRLRGYDPQTGQPYQMDSCPECDSLFMKNKQNLQNRKEELDRQLQLLEEQDQEEASRSSRPTVDEDGRAGGAGGGPNNAGGYGAPGPYGGWPPHAYYGAPPQSNPNGSGGPAPPHPYFPYGPPPMAPPQQAAAKDDANSEGSKYLVTLLKQKEEELKELRDKYEASQTASQEQSIQLALVQSKLDTMAQQFQAEKKVTQLEAQQKAQEEWQTRFQDLQREHLVEIREMQESMKLRALPAQAEANESIPPPMSTPKLDKPKELPAYSDLDDTTVDSEMFSETKAAPTTAATKKPWKKDPTTVKSETKEAASDAKRSVDTKKSPPNGDLQKETKEPDSSSIEGSDKVATKLEEEEAQDVFDTNLASDRFQPKYVDSNGIQEPLDPSDEQSLGQTVASSTYGEDRQKVVNQDLLDPYGDKGVYTGVVLRSTGMPHGLGRMLYEEDGRVYEGDWRHGRWHGCGRASFSNGDSYEGEYKFDQRHGQGKYKWHDGRVYDGQFSEDKRHGTGIFTWPDGAIYEGAFVNGQRQGHGKYTFADGGQYEGSWKDGRYDGFGTCTWEDGRKYQGEWRNGMAHGQGTETYPNGKVRHEGQWDNDEPVRF